VLIFIGIFIVLGFGAGKQRTADDQPKS
jgi:hypothetical protein